jgi:hypothetical protein
VASPSRLEQPLSAPVFLYVYSNGEIFFGNQGTINPTTSGELVSCFKINSDVSLRKITQLSGTVDSGHPNNKRRKLAATGGTGVFGNRFTVPEIT